MTLYCGLSAHCNQHEVSWEHGGRAPILGLSGVWGSPDGAVLGQVDRTAAEPEGSTDFPHAALTSLGLGECRPLPARDSFHSVAPLTAASHAPSHATATPPPSMKRKVQGSFQNGCLRRAGSLVFSSASSLSPRGWVTREPTVPGLFKDQEFLPSALKLLPKKVPIFS